MMPRATLTALFLLATSPGCALINSQSEAPNAPASDMAADLAVADMPGADMGADLDAADLPDDMPGDMPGDMSGDMSGDMDDMEMGVVNVCGVSPTVAATYDTLIACQAATDAMSGMSCYERGGTCAQVQRAPARYGCLNSAQLNTCAGRITLPEVAPAGPLAMTTDAMGGLHIFAVKKDTPNVWLHFARVEDGCGALTASAPRQAGAKLNALAAVAAPAPEDAGQVVIAQSITDANNTPRLSMSAWRSTDARYRHTLGDTRLPEGPTSTGNTITDALCSEESAVRLRAAPSLSAAPNVLLTSCYQSPDGGLLAATTPVRVPAMGNAVWGESYAAQGYTLWDEGAGVAGEGGRHIRLMSTQGGLVYVRSALWQKSGFGPGERAMGPGTVTTFGTTQERWFEARCADSELPMPGERHMILPHPTDATRAMVFVRTATHVRAIEWDDDTAGAMPAMQPMIHCGTELTQDARWRDRIAVGGTRWMAVGTTSMGHISVMSGSWAQEEVYEHRMFAPEELDAKALATDGGRVWLLGSRRGSSDDVFLMELTEEGAPMCAP